MVVVEMEVMVVVIELMETVVMVEMMIVVEGDVRLD